MKNLAIARAGEKSLHGSWLSEPGRKNFDLLVAYYGESPGKWQEGADFYDHTTGLKYPWFETFLQSSQWVFGYDAIWLADDDLAGDTATVSDAFDIFHSAGLWLAQPALTADSVISYEMMRREVGSLLRYVGFVEEQMPIFSRDCLKRLQPSLGETKSGWGLGIAWAQILGYPRDKMAVIDAAPMKHTRSLRTSDMYTTVLPALGKDPIVELNQIRHKYRDDMKKVVFGTLPLDSLDPLTPERRLRQNR